MARATGKHRIAIEGRLAGQHLVEDGAEHEQIAASVRDAAIDLLWRHVPRSPHHHTWHGQVLAACVERSRDGTRETEVEQFDAVLSEEDVRRLQIAMDDSLLMKGTKC
jgi:hypothetical protein